MTRVTGYRLHCSPSGLLSGFHVASGAAGTVELLVLPKVWADDPSIHWSGSAVRWDGDEPTMRLLLPELRSVTVYSDHEDRLELLASIGSDAARRRLRRRQRPPGTGDTAALSDETASDGSEIGGSEGDLANDDLHEDAGPLVTAFPVTRQAPVDTASVGSSTPSTDEVAASLGALATLGIATDLLELPVADLAPDRFRRLGPALLPIVHRRFVDEVTRQVRWSRRGYQRRTETQSAVQGRIHDTSVLRHQATGLPELTCTFDEFSRQTPLLRLIVTALEVVAARPGAPPSPFVRSTTHRAASLRRHLADVPATTPDDALRVGSGLRLDRPTRRWELARRLALASLSQRVNSLDRSPQTQVITHAELSVNTAAAWERLLLLALESIDGWQVTDGNARTSSAAPSGRWVIPAPWAGLGAARSPDLLLRPDQLDRPPVVIDAKYKVGRAQVSTADANQMFVYSHLATHHTTLRSHRPVQAGDPIGVVAVAFPKKSRGGTRGSDHQRQGTGGGDVTLEHWMVPFPHSMAMTEGDLDLHEMRSALKLLLTGAGVSAGGASDVGGRPSQERNDSQDT